MTEPEDGSEDEPQQEQRDPEAEPSGDLEELDELLHGEIVDDQDPSRRVQYARRFRGPLPHPGVLQQYNEVVDGLAMEIVDQWKGETAHRHRTVDGLRETDTRAMEAFYKAELRGQLIAAAIFLGVLAVAVVAILKHEQDIGIAAIVTAGGSAIWAMRRRSDGGPSGPPLDLNDGDELEKP